MTTDASSPPPSGFAALARRIGSWTSKGLVTAVLVVAAAGFGRQVLQWWGEEEGAGIPPGRIANPYAGLGDESLEHELRFGEHPWSMRRQVFRGDAKTAAAALAAKCREAAASGALPPGPPGPQEQRFLENLAGRAPVVQGGDWAVYRFSDSVPMVAGVRRVAKQEEGDTSGSPGRQPEAGRGRTDASPSVPRSPVVAQTDLRVVSWGFGVPGAQGAWTLYTLVAAPPSGGPGAERVPVPPECTPTLSLRVAEGGGLVTFRGPERPGTWKAFYDQHFRRRGWKLAGAWQEHGGRWSARFVQAGAPGAAAVDIQFGPDGQGGMTGLLMTAPGAVEQKEGEDL